MSSHSPDFQDKEFNGLVLFSASWCAACKVVTPILEKISNHQDHHQIKFLKIDVSRWPGLASRMGVVSLPNILIIKEGKVAGQIIGATSQKEIENKLKKIL